MSILSMLSRTTLGIGVKDPTSYIKKVQSRGLKTTQELADAAGQGYAFRDPSLGSDKYVNNLPQSVNTNSILQSNASNYQDTMFSAMLAGTNRLVDDTAKTYAFRPGNFSKNLTSYTDKLFKEQLAAAGRATNTPTSLVSNIIQTPLILTPISPTNGTGAGMPFDDGRYIPTIGYGFVLYGTLAKGGYGE